MSQIVAEGKPAKALDPKTKRMIELLHRKAPVRPGKLRRQAEQVRRAELAAQNLLVKLKAKQATAPRPARAWDPEAKSPAHLVNNAIWKTGAKIKFPRSGTVYEKQLAGNMVRLHPVKPYKNRAEQKRYNKARREMRAEDARQAEAAMYGSYQD